MKCLLAATAIIISSICFGQISEQTALARAEAFAERMDPETARTDRASFRAHRKTRLHLGRSEHRWSISGGIQLLSLDDNTGSIVLYSHSGRYDAINGPGSSNGPKFGVPFYRNESDLIAKASGVLTSLGWDHGSTVHKQRPFPIADAGGKIPHTIVYVTFYESANGYVLEGGGNYCLVGFDSLSGSVVELQREMGFQFGPSVVGVDSQRALQSAAKMIEVGQSPVVRGPVYRVLIESGSLTDRATQLCRDKVVPLAYIVSGRREDAYVAADNGEVLETISNLTGGGPLRTSAGPGKTGSAPSTESKFDDKGKTAKAGPQDGPAMTSTWLIAVGVLLLGWLGYAFARRS